MDSDKGVCCHHSSSYMNWMDSHSGVEEGVTVVSCKINRLLLVGRVFRMHSIGFLVQPCRNENQHQKYRGIMSLHKPKAVYAASERQYTAAGGEIQVPRVVFTSDGRWGEEVDTRIAEVNAVLRELYRSVVTKRELSNTAKLSVFTVNRSCSDPCLWSCILGNNRNNNIPGSPDRDGIFVKSPWCDTSQ